MSITKIISGGQTGADLGALLAAESLDIGTGGWMPPGFHAEDGRHSDFQARFGMSEVVEPVSISRAYAIRTARNVMDSDGTIGIALNHASPGMQCTRNAIDAHAKPLYLIRWKADKPFTDLQGSLDWIHENKISTLNVAGNRESSAPGIQVWTYTFIQQLVVLSRGR